MARSRSSQSDKNGISQQRNRARLAQAQAAGLLGSRKSTRIAGRVAPELIAAAKKSAGVSSDTDVIEIALAALALEDDFGRKLVRRKDSVPKDLKLEL